MIGLPEETLEDIELSKQLIMEARPDHVEINMVTPYPGTDIFEKLMPEDPAEDRPLVSLVPPGHGHPFGPPRF